MFTAQYIRYLLLEISSMQFTVHVDLHKTQNEVNVEDYIYLFNIL